MLTPEQINAIQTSDAINNVRMWLSVNVLSQSPIIAGVRALIADVDKLITHSSEVLTENSTLWENAKLNNEEIDRLRQENNELKSQANAAGIADYPPI